MTTIMEMPRHLVAQVRGVTDFRGVDMTEVTPLCARPTKKFPEGRTGRPSGYQAHRKAGEDACDLCRLSHNEKTRQKQNLEVHRERRRADYAENRVSYAFKAIKRNYGLSQKAYEALLAAQDGGCAVCGTTEPGGRGLLLNVDHDHMCCPGQKSCGKCVRGLLCARCNVGLGSFQDNPERLFAAAAYLLSRAKEAS